MIESKLEKIFGLLKLILIFQLLIIKKSGKVELFWNTMAKQIQSYKILCQLLQTTSQSNGWRKYLKKNLELINYQKASILNLCTQTIKKIYLNVSKRNPRGKGEEAGQINDFHDYWYENQLRIFIYIMFAHLFLEKIHIESMNDQNYLFLNRIFKSKTKEYIEYQIKNLIKQKNSRWSKNESQLFQQITTQIFKESIETSETNYLYNRTVKKWNFIAKQLYIRSNGKHFKTPKQCRQRWINYIDPNIIRGNWTLEQDLNLMITIQEIGKKWTQISRKLDNKRTQNNVKNRYNSLIKKQAKKYDTYLKEQVLIALTIERIRKNLQNQQFKGAVGVQEVQNQSIIINQILDSISEQNIKNQQFNEHQKQQILINSKVQNYNKNNQNETYHDGSHLVQNIDFRSAANDFQQQQMQNIQCESFFNFNNFNQDIKWVENYFMVDQEDHIRWEIAKN